VKAKFSRKSWQFLALCGACLAGGSNVANAASLAITGTVSHTIGTTAVISLGTSGTADNTTTWSTAAPVGVFQMNGGAYYMQVNATAPTGGLSPGNDSLMVTRTVNSQGLVDTGTLSVYVRPDPLTATPWSLKLNFSFYSDASRTMPAPLQLQLTSLDIDYAQRYYTSNASFDGNVTSVGTDLIAPGTAVSGYTGFTTVPNANSAFNDPAHAVASYGYGSSFDVSIAHDAVALFMFEFRDPSLVTGLVPEPSSSLLLLGGVSMLCFVRRRSQVA